jgi:predicted ATPase
MKLASLGDLRRKIKFARPQGGATHALSKADGKKLDLYLVNAFCGLNGSGKTRLLKCIESADPVSTLDEFEIYKADARSIYISPADLVSQSIRKTNQLKSQGNFEELIQAYEPFELGGDLLAKVNYVIHSNFRKISILTLEGIEGQYGQEASSFQYCVAEKIDGVWDTLTLSHGEIYAILMIWTMATGEGFNVVLVDEPETFLSPLAQTRLSHVLIEFSASSRSNNIQVIAATHSPYILDAIGYDHSFAVSKEVGKLSIVPANKSILSSLGITHEQKKILFVEDAKAKFLLESILDNFLPAWKHNTVVFACENGESDLSEIYGRVIDKGEDKIFLIYDGDIIDKGVNFSDDEKKYSFLLPGQKAPEDELIDAAISSLDEFVELFPGTLKDKIKASLEASNGLEHHDYFVELAKRSGVHEFFILECAFQIWLKSNREGCVLLVAQIQC